MLRKLGKKITNNFGLKILAALFAVVLWVVVVNIDDPVKTKMYTTSVQPANEAYITEQGKYYEWLEGKNTISFNVSATRSVLEKLSSSDFSAIADMEKIEYAEEGGTCRVPITITATKSSSDVTISSKQLYLEVVLEDLGTCQKAIMANTRGNVADGCALGELKIVGSNVLKISGPYSIVSQIDTAQATINVDGMSEDVTDSVVPVLYDEKGNVIDTTKLRLSLNTVTISAQILNTKDVALEFSTAGTVAEGYMQTGIEHNLDTVRIKGEAATLNPINKITIPAEVLDVTDISEDLVTTVDISSYLPAGTSLVLNSDAKVEVTVKVEPIITKQYEVPVANLAVENLRDGYTLEYDVDTVSVEIGGIESTMAELKAKDITGTVNMGNLGAGEHQLEVNFALDGEKCWVSIPVKVPVTITRNEGNTGNDNEEDETDGEADEVERPVTEDTGTGGSGTGSGMGTGGSGTGSSGAGSDTGTGNNGTDTTDGSDKTGGTDTTPTMNTTGTTTPESSEKSVDSEKTE